MTKSLPRTLAPIGLLFVLCVAVAGARAGAVDHVPIEAFYGKYIGHSEVEFGEGLSERDFNVEIEPRDGHGFIVTWVTFTHRADGTMKRKTYSIEFRPTQREGIYSSAEETDLFGARVPRDPMEGEPYTWATLRGKVLTVYALIITDDGGYELQQYDRALTDDGLLLDFTRIRNGEELRRITGTLMRVTE